MPRKRLTREKAREQTRRRLLDAAALSIARKGLAATSVEDIVTQAAIPAARSTQTSTARAAYSSNCSVSIIRTSENNYRSC
jgi:hypothetical protein